MSAEPTTGQFDTDERAAPTPVVLVADDEPINLTLIKRRLEWEGHRVVTARDGSEAVTRAREAAPDVIILDVMMPVMDGMQACRVLKADPETKHIPVIFLSALDDTETKVNGLAVGANDYISKPFRAEELVARVAVAIRLKRERDQLRVRAEEARRRAEAASELSMTDALTRLLNRHGLRRSLQREHAEARRYARPLACLMIDIDRFKQINDTQGHTAGDAALVQVARVLADTVRASDVVCRYGGEEFLVLAPETSLEGAVALGEKIRLAAAAALYGGVHAGAQFPLTLSLGAAELAEGESGHDLVARADAALYEAKQRGRNRVEAAPTHD